MLGDAPASFVEPKWYKDALFICLRGSHVTCAEEVLTRLGCLQGDAYAISRPDNWRRTARDLLVSLKPCEDLQKRVMMEIGEDITIEDDAAMIEAAALGAARYIRDAPAIIRKRRIEDTSLDSALGTRCCSRFRKIGRARRRGPRKRFDSQGRRERCITLSCERAAPSMP